MKFTIVTPVYNGARFIRETIESVLSQAGSFDLEYIIVDGQSADGTVAICQEFADRLDAHTYPYACHSVSLQIISEPDQGMYSAINKGFRRATGDIYAYLNADDLYKSKALQTVSEVFSDCLTVDWLKGVTTVMEENSTPVQRIPFQGYHQAWIRDGIYGREAYFIHQDSVFWRASLWQSIDHIDERYRLAGDYDLWCKFAAHTPLYSIDTDLSLFRKSAQQLSQQMDRYRAEQERIIPHSYTFEHRRIVWFFWLKNKFPKSWIPLFRHLFPLVFPGRIHSFIITDEQGHYRPLLSSSFLP